MINNKPDSNYPKNLIDDVINLFVAKKFGIKETIEYPDDVDGSVEYAMSMLEKRDRDILHMRYRDGMTYDEIGKIEDISRERVRQLINKALADIRKPPCIVYIIYGVKEIEKRKAKRYLDEVKLLRETICSVSNAVCKYTTKPQFAEIMLETEFTKNPEIIDLNRLDLSIRTNQALKRANIMTVYDIITTPPTEIMSIKNLGLHAFMDVIKQMEINGWDMTQYRRAANSRKATKL